VAKLKISRSLAQPRRCSNTASYTALSPKRRSAPSSAVERVTKSEIPPTHWDERVEILQRYAYTAQPTMQQPSSSQATLKQHWGRLSGKTSGSSHLDCLRKIFRLVAPYLDCRDITLRVSAGILRLYVVLIGAANRTGSFGAQLGSAP